MRDDFLGRDWAENHYQMSDGIAALFARVARGWGRLAARQFDAPWRADKRESC